MAKSLQKLSSDVAAINSAVKGIDIKTNEFLVEQAYGVVSTEIANVDGSGNPLALGVINLDANMKGKMLRYSKVLLTFPDGSNPLVITNDFGNQPGPGTEDEFVVRFGSAGAEIFPETSYPVGSLILGLDYEANTVLGAAGSADATGGDVQYYSGGALAGSSSGSPTGSPYDFKFNPASGVVTAEGFAGDLSSTSSLDNGVTATTQSVGDNTTKVATTAFVQANGGASPGGSNYSVQFNDSLGGFEGESSFTYSPTNNTLSCANIDSSFSGSYGDIKGKLKGDNIGTGIYATGSAKYWYLTPYDFLGATSGSGILTSAGNYMMMPSASAFYMVSIQIPVGYKLVKIFIKGNVANSFSVQSSSWSSLYGGSFGSGTVNTELTLSTPVNSTEGNYITLSINPSGSYNRIYGARLTLEEI